MMRKQSYWGAICGSSLLALGFVATVQAAPLISTAPALTYANTTDYSKSGVNLGQDGFWFANFGAGSAQTLQPVDTNDANSLPSYIGVNFTKGDPGYGFSNTGNAAYGSIGVAYSDGGQAGYNNLTLPDASSGLSGQLVDTQNVTGTQSQTIIPNWYYLPGAPSAVYVSVVLDNVGTGTPPNGPTAVNRIRVRNFDSEGAFQEAEFASLVSNGTADVYTFKLTNLDTTVGSKGNPGYFTVQLRTGGNTAGTADVGLAGIMFTPIPEPSSVVLLAIGALCVAGTAARRARKGKV
jgi:hypothetical protein